MPISSSRDYPCEHELVHNREKDIVFCKLCGDRWEKENTLTMPGTTTTTPWQSVECGTTQGCMWDNVKPGTACGMVCPCSKCSPTC